MNLVSQVVGSAVMLPTPVTQENNTAKKGRQVGAPRDREMDDGRAVGMKIRFLASSCVGNSHVRRKRICSMMTSERFSRILGDISYTAYETSIANLSCHEIPRGTKLGYEFDARNHTRLVRFARPCDHGATPPATTAGRPRPPCAPDNTQYKNFGICPWSSQCSSMPLLF